MLNMQTSYNDTFSIHSDQSLSFPSFPLDTVMIVGVATTEVVCSEVT